ncbi:hypothetical protein [Microscilla marina]|uniref:Uncharacterized protein n=1 Tax=Microscilla marina ATCC 23134 TaxID=313606 RepID=A1ZKC9_MICM2|nr:hypothetical protein [Microscilla marina]EAY29155.1 hypothetical protein M23134_02346 [Microscilla marina ATCC 23134]
MQDNQNLQAQPNQTPEQKAISLRIEHLLIFQLSLRHRLEKFAFDADDILELMPRTTQPYNRQSVQQASSQLQAMRKELDYLINEVNLCAGLIPLDEVD